MKVRYYHRVLELDLPEWLAIGWQETSRSISPSVGWIVLIEWAGDGPAPEPGGAHA
jgi:hypothetical protein